MTKLLLLLPLIISCAHQKMSPSESEDIVSLNTALFQARSSYLLGCTEARVELKKDAFDHCSHKAEKHLQDLKSIMQQGLD